jgi:hypothetical protein
MVGKPVYLEVYTLRVPETRFLAASTQAVE